MLFYYTNTKYKYLKPSNNLLFIIHNSFGSKGILVYNDLDWLIQTLGYIWYNFVSITLFQKHITLLVSYFNYVQITTNNESFIKLQNSIFLKSN